MIIHREIKVELNNASSLFQQNVKNLGMSIDTCLRFGIYIKKIDSGGLMQIGNQCIQRGVY